MSSNHSQVHFFSFSIYAFFLFLSSSFFFFFLLLSSSFFFSSFFFSFLTLSLTLCEFGGLICCLCAHVFICVSSGKIRGTRRCMTRKRNGEDR